MPKLFILTCFLALLFLSFISVADTVDAIETVEIVDVTDSSVSDTSFSFLNFVGRHHAAAVHLPIGLLFALLLTEFAGIFFNKGKSPECTYVLTIAAALSFLPAALTGMLRGNEMFLGQNPPDVFYLHRNLMIISGAVLISALGLRIYKKNNPVGKYKTIQLVLVVLAFCLAAFGGHSGGIMVYGEDFLPY